METCRTILFFRLKDIFAAVNKAFGRLRVLEAGVRSPVVLSRCVFEWWLADFQIAATVPCKAKELLRSSPVKVGGLDDWVEMWSFHNRSRFSFWTVIPWVNADVVDSAIQFDPVGAVDAAFVAADGTERKGRGDMKPPAGEA